MPYQIKTLFFIILFSIPTCILGQSLEYKTKASFIEKFTKFIEWENDSTITDTTKSFYISIIGNDPFNGFLEKIFTTIKIKNKTVKVQHISKITENTNCHILFIPIIKKDKLKEIIEATKNKPILLISDSDGFAKLGVHINLFISTTGTIRFEINPEAAKNSGLSISYLLISMAKIVSFE